MRAAIFGIATIAAAAFLPASASALPFAGIQAPASGFEQARVVRRTVIRGPRCRTVVTKRRGPLGRVVVTRTRRCL